MDPIKKNDSGAAVEDVQHRLVKAGYLAEDQVTGTFGAETENAVLSLCRDCGIEPRARWTTPFGPNWLTRRSNWATQPVLARPVLPRCRCAYAPGSSFRAGLFLRYCRRYFWCSYGRCAASFPAEHGLAHRRHCRCIHVPRALHLQHSWKGKDSSSPVPRLGFAARLRCRIEPYLPFRHIGIHPFGCCSYVELGACHYSGIEGYQRRFVAGCSR